MKETKLVAIGESGCRVGADHPRATLTESEVDLIRELAEGGMKQRLIAEKFEISRGTVSDIVRYRRRATFVAGFRRVKVTIAGREMRHRPRGNVAPSSLHERPGSSQSQSANGNGPAMKPDRFRSSSE